MPIAIPSLSIEIAKSCNLSCDGCNHFSNLSGLKSLLTADDVAENIVPWATHLAPAVFRVVGGEPFICPDILASLSVIHKTFPAARIDIFTNGLLLKNDKFDDEFGASLASLGAGIRVSVHSLEPSFLDRLKPVRDKLKHWHKQYKLGFEFADAVTTWTWPYKHIDGKIHPYADNDQRRSWDKCVGKWCKQIYNGKIYKCQLTAYLQDVIDKLDDSFLPYLQYSPIAPTASPEEMAVFFSREDEWACAACPANPQKFIKAV